MLTCGWELIHNAKGVAETLRCGFDPPRVGGSTSPYMRIRTSAAGLCQQLVFQWVNKEAGLLGFSGKKCRGDKELNLHNGEVVPGATPPIGSGVAEMKYRVNKY